MNDTESETPVIFTWADREGSSWWLAVFIFLSFLLHSAAFFIFQGREAAPRRAILTAPLVQMLSASAESAAQSPENDALLRWIATNDPALIAQTRAVEPRGLRPVPYVASFQTLRTPPLGAPRAETALVIPPAHDPLALIRSVFPAEKIAPAVPQSQRTQVEVSASLQSRARAGFSFAPRARTRAILQPSCVLAGVTAEGETRFVFLEQACGEPALDEEALTFVRALRFAAAGDAMQWATVSIAWGDEVIAPPAQE